MTEHWAEQTGLILFTENYEDCVRFYRDVVELDILFAKDSLTCFSFGTSYLMVETDGVAVAGEKSFAQNAVTLRLNVKDVAERADLLRQRGADVTIHQWDWGVTGLFLDPDGNRVELKDHAGGFVQP